jgi:hypothetical protein
VAIVILAVVQPGHWPLRSLLSLPPVVWIGKISYGLYLWHWPVIVVMTPNRTGLHGGVLTLTRVAVTVAISTVSFYLVEQPIRRGALSRLPKRLVFATAPAGFAVAGLAIVAATAGAKPPPDFLQADPGKVISSADEFPDLPSTTVPAVTDPGAPVAPATGPQRVLLVGDSIAYSLYDSVKSAAYTEGVPVYQVVVSGCGIAGGLATDANGTPYPWSQACIEAVPYEQGRVIEQLQPDLVVWLSVWETSDRIVDGELVRFGTKTGDKVARDEIDAAAERLTAGGAQLALVTLPLPAEEAEIPPEIDYGPSIQRLNKLLRQYAADHPDTTRVVDLGEIVCPDGPPCPAEIAGVRLRPRDGVHYEGDGATYVAQQLVPRLLATPSPTP